MSTTNAPPVVLTIAGYDPSSGAGVTADIKTIAAHRCFGISCITALTVQSTQGVRKVEPVSPETVHETLCELARDFEISAVHVGMLGSVAVAGTVAAFLEQQTLPNVVLDPVLKSSSGADLLDEQGVEVLRRRLIPLATVTTPNLEEAALLTKSQIDRVDDMRTAAGHLHNLGARNVVITGGHLPYPLDLLSAERGEQVDEFPGERIESRATHGTGCAFSTALACNLALGRTLRESVRLSGEYVRQAMAAAHPLGTGKGPLNHLFGLDRM